MDANQKRMQFAGCFGLGIRFGVVCAASLWGFHAFAQSQNSSRLSFGYGSKVANFYGVYSPKPGVPAKNGLDAELEARAEGIKNLETHLDQKCEQTPADSIQLQSGWKKSVRSLGSDIFKNSTLKISLAINIRDLFKRKDPTLFLPIDTEADFAFHLPAIPFEKTKCSLLKAKLFGQILWVQPLSVTKSETRKTISVIFDKDSLVIGKKEDQDWLSEHAELPDVWSEKYVLEIPVSSR
jgi:hypothetical protein